MSLIVNTSESTPHPMGRMATCQTRIGDVVHRHAACGTEHMLEVCAQDARVADRLQDIHLRAEYPVAAVAQDPAKPFVDVVGDGRVSALAGDERTNQQGQGCAHRQCEAPVAHDPLREVD